MFETTENLSSELNILGESLIAEEVWILVYEPGKISDSFANESKFNFSFLMSKNKRKGRLTKGLKLFKSMGTFSYFCLNINKELWKSNSC